jgi:hypothetical protein
MTFDRENSSRRKLEIAAVRASGTPRVLLIGIVGALTLDFGCFSTYAKYAEFRTLGSYQFPNWRAS